MRGEKFKFMKLAEKLKEELNIEILLKVKLPLINQVNIRESVVVTWIVMAVFLVICILLTRNFKTKNPGRRQVIVETAVTWLQNMVSGMLGEEAKEYTSYISAILVYIVLSNTIGIFGLKPPTKDMNVTIALSLMSIVLVQIAGIRRKKVGGWMKSFTQPVAIITPLNILEIVIKPLSLCMRLFGNVLGAFVIMELIKILVPVAVPVPFGLYFDLFDGILQAYVFVFLTSLYIKEAVE